MPWRCLAIFAALLASHPATADSTDSPASQTQNSPQISPVASDAFTLTLVDGEIRQGLREPYKPQEGDEIEESGGRVPAWNESVIELHPQKRMLFRRFAGGRRAVGFVFRPRGQGEPWIWREETVREPWPDRALDDAGSYLLSSSEDSRFETGLKPVVVHRKSKPVDGNEITGEKIVGHTVTLIWPHQLVEGKSYTLEYPRPDGSKVRLQYRHDPAHSESEAIHVNQIGYVPDDPFKRAFLSFWTGTGGGINYDTTRFFLIENSSRRVVFEGDVGASYPSERAERFRTVRNFVGADVHPMDFHDFAEPGEYRVFVPGVGVSKPFVIDERASWAAAFRASMRGLLHHRSGIELGSPFTSYRRPRPMHPEDGVKVFKIPYTMLEGESAIVAAAIEEKLKSGRPQDEWPTHDGSWGGYMDAGDWDRRSQHLSVSRHLAELFSLNPKFFETFRLDLPAKEFSDRIPDVLNEVIWNTAFYRRLQDVDGGVRGGMESTAHPLPGEASWEESLVLGVFAPDPYSSYSYAGTAALLSRMLAPYDPEQAKAYAESASRAWEWAEANHSRVLNEAEARSVATARGSEGKTFNRPEAEKLADRMRLVASADLFALTGDQRFHDAFEMMLRTAGSDPDEIGAMFRYAMLPSDQTEPKLRAEITQRITQLADASLDFGKGNAFGIHTPAHQLPIMGYTGFYSVPETVAGPVLPRAHALTGASKYLRGALHAAHFSAGANPLNMTFTTGVGHAFPRNPLHIDSRVTGQSAPEGITIYGPMDASGDFAFNDWVHKWHLRDMHPASRTWPASEWHVDYFRWPAMSEYTVHQTFRPTAYYWGYLAARANHKPNPTPAPISMKSRRQRPNFLVIQCDDLGIDDLGLYNPRVHTPNIDALAAESVRFSDFTVNPVCAPSRATFLTGRHFLKTGVSHVHGGKDFLHLDERTLADHFRAAGYATGMWGKWHSGFTEGYHPWQRGFSEAWTSELYRHRDARGIFNGKDVTTDRWADEVIANYVIEFIQRHRDQPFFAYVPTMTPHGPLDAPEKWVQFYRDRGCSEALAKLWGMVSALDEQVGRMLKSLEECGLRDQTLVVFMSDNGPAIEQRTLSDEDRKLRKMSGLRGWKGDLYENGVRSPLFIRWPAHLAPRDITPPTDLVDLAPTLIDMAGILPVPEAPPMDGVSFLGQLRGSTPASPDAVIVNYAHRGWLTSGPVYSLDGLPGEYLPISTMEKRLMKFEDQSISIRKGNLKWIVNPDFEKPAPSGSGILFDLANDPSESTNVAGQYPEAVVELNGRLREWWEQITLSPHSLAVPVFHIRPGSNRIPARAPARVTGEVFNNVVELKGWSGPGDAASYSMFSPNPTKAKITLEWKGQVPEGVEWSIAVPETGHEVRVGKDGVAAVALPAGEFHLEMKMEEVLPGAVIPPLRAIIAETANNAPWNMPVGEIPLHPESDHYCDLLWNHATADRPGNFNLTFEDYTYPVYETTAATGEFPVRTKWETNLNGKMMPWNPEWKPPPGSDAQIIVLDPTTGREWNLWQVRFDGKTIHATNGNLVQKGEDAGDGLDPGDYRTKENGFRPSRGIGIQYLAMLVRPQEVRDGVIRHALSMPIKNPDGTFFVPPATKLENYQDRGQPGIPEGMRFSLMVTDVEIDAWIADLPEALSAEARRAARTIAVALREYGWFITDTSGGAHFQFEARMTAAKEWEELGLGPMDTIHWKDYPQDLLDGLITRERLRAHVPSDQYPR